MDNKYKPPCHSCICLPTCIQTYKYFYKDHMNPAAWINLDDDCEMSSEYNSGRGKEIENWWKDNYGK